MTTLHADYRRLRAAGYPAGLALYALRQPAPPPLDWRAGIACWSEQGFDLTARLIPDPLADLAHLGRFSAHRRPGAVRLDRHTPWFVPATSEDVQCQALRTLKMGRAQACLLARRQVLDAGRRAISHGDTWFLGVLTVTACRCGVLLGEACLGGVESDADPAYRDLLSQELATEAIAEAQGVLEQLCQGRH